jgi:recombination protein RecR
MLQLPQSVKSVIEALAQLPSIGPRQATRLVFYLIGRGQNYIQTLAADLKGLERIKLCERCFFIHENSGALCDICGNPARKPDIIMVIEKETDLISLENTGKFTGRYFIIGSIPKAGALEEWQKLRLQGLKRFIETSPPAGPGGQAQEVIIAFNPTATGDFGATLIEKELRGLSKKISRLGRGLPTGGEIEFADDETLGSALERRG